jgi:hypothetical protein
MRAAPAVPLDMVAHAQPIQSLADAILYAHDDFPDRSRPSLKLFQEYFVELFHPVPPMRQACFLQSVIVASFLLRASLPSVNRSRTNL